MVLISSIPDSNPASVPLTNGKVASIQTGQGGWHSSDDCSCCAVNRCHATALIYDEPSGDGETSKIDNKKSRDFRLKKHRSKT